MPELAVFVQAAFVLPQTFPVTVNTLNYAGVAVGIVMLAALLFWFLPFGLGARRWFRGEIKTAKIPFDSVCLSCPYHLLLCMLERGMPELKSTHSMAPACSKDRHLLTRQHLAQQHVTAQRIEHEAVGIVFSMLTELYHAYTEGCCMAEEHAEQEDWEE